MIANITIACTSGSVIGIFYQVRTTKWTSGQVHTMVDSLFKIYVLQDMAYKIELRRSLNAVSMKKEEDPASLFEAIYGINNKYTTASYQF